MIKDLISPQIVITVVNTLITMKNLQFLLFAFILVFTACQGEPATQVKTAIDKTPKAVATSDTGMSDTKADSADEDASMEDAKAKKPEVIEFYVEEDKKKTEKKKSASTKTAGTNTKKAAKKKTRSSKKSAKMKFDNDTFAFGVIKPGEVIEHKFEFTNTGTTDLVITNAEATCGCTQPSFPFIPIPPGEKGFIGVKYDSTGKLGTQKPTVTLTTNAYPKTQKVYLEGVVIGKMAN